MPGIRRGLWNVIEGYRLASEAAGCSLLVEARQFISKLNTHCHNVLWIR